MPLLGEPCYGDLPATRSYCRRHWQWEPAGWSYADGRDGTLTIGLSVANQRGHRTPLTRYAVQVLWPECDPAAGVWAFLLDAEPAPNEPAPGWDELEADRSRSAKGKEPRIREPYKCVVGGTRADCTCTAGNMDHTRYEPTGCKHRDSLAALIAKAARLEELFRV